MQQTIHHPRTFHVVTKDGYSYNCYFAKHPVIAAKKAFAQMCKENEADPLFCQKLIHFTIIESTEFSKRQRYNYIGMLIEHHRPVPITVRRKGQSTHYSLVQRI